MRPPSPADSGRSALDSSVVGVPLRSSGPHSAASGERARATDGACSPHRWLKPWRSCPIRASGLPTPGSATAAASPRPLPVDTTCAAAARRFFREAVSSLSIPSGLVHDGVTMASELAANTLHAQRNEAEAAARQRSAAGIPEIWLYLRGTGRTRELVCKVFDTERGWAPGSRPGMADAPLDSVSGRGLQVVAGLSAGQWGCHLSRSRLGNWKVPGKAVWFSLRIPPAVLPDHLGRPRYGADWLTDELEAMLADRGLSSIVRADLDSISVLSISRHLTVWRRGDEVSWRTPSGGTSGWT